MLGKRLHQARLLAGISQEQLVNELAKYNYPITKQAISKYENNQSVAPAQFLILAASILNVPIEYIDNELPLKIEQMAHHAVAEGLMSPDRIRRVYPQWKEQSTAGQRDEHLTVYDLLAMSEEERNKVMKEAFDLASKDELEIFEAFDEMDFADDSI